MASRRARSRTAPDWDEPTPQPEEPAPEYLATGEPLDEVLQETKGTE